MKKKEAVKTYIDRANGWVASYDLIHHELCGVWVGNSGDREARRYADEKKIYRKDGAELLRDGIETDHKDKPIDRTYTYFRALVPLVQVPIYALMPDGTKKLVKINYEPRGEAENN